MKLELIIPHNFKKQGASTPEAPLGYDQSITEYTYAQQELLFSHSMTTQECQIELHKNAFNNESRGAMILVLKGDLDSGLTAKKIVDAFCLKFHRRNRGVKLLEEGDRGYRNLKTMKDKGAKCAMLSELFFIDNPYEWIEPQEMGKFWREVQSEL